MKSKKVKQSKNYFKKRSELLHKAILKLLEVISEEHNIPIQSLNELYKNWIDKKV